MVTKIPTEKHSGQEQPQRKPENTHKKQNKPHAPKLPIILRNVLLSGFIQEKSNSKNFCLCNIKQLATD